MKKKPKGTRTINKTFKRELQFKEHLEEYAKVTEVLGNRRLTVVLPNKEKLLAHIPGRFKRRVWITKEDIILVSLRDFEKSKCDVCHKYTLEESRDLVRYNEIPESFINTNNYDEIQDNLDIIFQYNSDDEVDIDNI
tara:strand:+ start:3373 stop:3783 length:411 start_codon:yes stop_codon:yes gene_type:complete